MRKHGEIQYVGDAYHLEVIQAINRELFNESHIRKQRLVSDKPADKKEIFEAIRGMSSTLPIVIGLYNVSEHVRAEFSEKKNVILIYDSFNVHLENVVDAQPDSTVSLDGLEEYSCEYNGVKDFDKLFE